MVGACRLLARSRGRDWIWSDGVVGRESLGRGGEGIRLRA